MSTYDSLTQDVQDWAEDDDTAFVAEIDNFIALAEEKIFSEAPLHTAFKNTDTGNLVQGTNTVTLDADVRTIRDVAITVSSEKVFLQQRTEAYLEDYWPNSSTEAEPKFYSQENETTLLLAPTPDSAYAYKIRSYALPTGLSSGNPTTWISTNKPNLLLAACMVKVMEFQKNAEGLEAWGVAYRIALKPFLAEMARNIGNENTTGV